jgi:hypothetical protein
MRRLCPRTIKAGNLSSVARSTTSSIVDVPRHHGAESFITAELSGLLYMYRQTVSSSTKPWRLIVVSTNHRPGNDTGRIIGASFSLPWRFFQATVPGHPAETTGHPVDTKGYNVKPSNRTVGMSVQSLVSIIDHDSDEEDHHHYELAAGRGQSIVVKAATRRPVITRQVRSGQCSLWQSDSMRPWVAYSLLRWPPGSAYLLRYLPKTGLAQNVVHGSTR